MGRAGQDVVRSLAREGTDLSTFSQDDLAAIADNLNYRPRAIHDFNTPLATFAGLIAMTHQPSSSIH